MAECIQLNYQMSLKIILLKEFSAFCIVIRKEKIFLEIMGLYKLWKEDYKNRIIQD